MAEAKKNEEKKSFKETLNLPHTDFPIRTQPAVEDPIMLARWQREGLSRSSFDLNEGNPKFILHDGPPYANGHIHLGHAYNKILKDILTKSRRMMGYHVPVMPGWDCHGLPIEIKVVQEQPGLDRDDLIKACREYAQRWIDVQREEFKELGVLMDWDRPYATMDKGYEASVVRAFKILVEHDFIERKNKTVPWCATCRTVLATAEIEHKDRRDPSIYVAFDLKPEDAQRLFPTIQGKVGIAVWTTTPWTLPLNQAVLAKPDGQYVLIDCDGRYVIISAKTAPKIGPLLKSGSTDLGPADVAAPVILEEFTGNKLKDLQIFHPFIDKMVPVVFDDSVVIDEGTGLVHCAPGVGPSDYEVGVKNKLEIYSPLSADGRYTDLIQPAELSGMAVADGQGWVIKKLLELGTLLYKGSITHSYPHCWRCRNGLIFRATPQWFFNLERKNVKQRVLDAVETLSFIPPQGKNALRATVESRWEWCLSRQRVWGVPIPAFICNQCDHAFLQTDVLDKVAQGIEREGIEYWARVPLEELLSPAVCPRCHMDDLRKETDILDVWLESGVSHFAVLYNNPALAFPADVYLEGIDQYRAWFQSSLIMSMVLEEEPSMRTIISHGFTVDGKGQKMSKSLGNVISPGEMTKKLGTDGLRLWAASIGHERDAVVSDTLVKNVAEVHRKVRNTCRFLLSNLSDFDNGRHRVAPDKLMPLDLYAMTELSRVNAEIIKAYMEADFTAVFHLLPEYCTVELSAFYLDIVKDRLYCERADSLERRSAQTALWYILDTLTRLIAPVLSFTAEQIADHYQKDKKESIHLQPFVDPQKLIDFCHPRGERLWPDIIGLQTGWFVRISYDVEQEQRAIAYATQWQTLKDIRSVLLKAIEGEREKGLIKHSLEAQVKVYIDLKNPKFASIVDFFKELKAQGYSADAFLKEFLIVSNFILVDSRDGLSPSTDESIAVLVTHAQGVKCPRCWHWDDTGHPDNLCKRCMRVLGI